MPIRDFYAKHDKEYQKLQVEETTLFTMVYLWTSNIYISKLSTVTQILLNAR